MILVAIEIITFESPSIMRGCKLRDEASVIPRMRPQISVELFVSCPINPPLRCSIFPVLSLMTTPKPTGPGFPLEAPSKFSFQKPGGGQL
jgi:hypothetical protein